MPKSIPDQCRTCVYLWTHGVKDGKHDRWCTHYGKPAPAAIGHCKQMGGYKPKTHSVDSVFVSTV